MKVGLTVPEMVIYKKGTRNCHPLAKKLGIVVQMVEFLPENWIQKAMKMAMKMAIHSAETMIFVRACTLAIGKDTRDH